MTTLWKGTAGKLFRTLAVAGMALSGILIVSAPSAKGARKTAGIRVLILSGLNNHEWRATTPVLVEMFKAEHRFGVVNVSEEPGKLTAKDFRKYDVIVSN
jgi:hypothetical protein